MYNSSKFVTDAIYFTMKINKHKLFLLFFWTIIISCSESDDNSSNDIIFLEQHKETHGTLLSGTEPPAIQIDFPTYNFDITTKTLNGITEFELNDNLKLIYGSGECLSGFAGGGCGTGLLGVYNIPYERGSFELLKIDEDGSVVLMYEEEVMNLAPGEEWITENTKYDTTFWNNGNQSIVELTENNRITNFGFIQKDNIKSWSW